MYVLWIRHDSYKFIAYVACRNFSDRRRASFKNISNFGERLSAASNITMPMSYKEKC